jgi:diguanylate cyclase (GGDEF)-like protein
MRLIAHALQPLPMSGPVIQWRLLDAQFQMMRQIRMAALLPPTGGVMIYMLTGQSWGLAWGATCLALTLAGHVLAGEFEKRDAREGLRHWSGRFTAAACAQAAALGVGGLAAQSGGIETAIVIACVIGCMNCHGSAFAESAGIARMQALLSQVPFVVVCAARGQPDYLVLAAFVTLLGLASISLAEASAGRAFLRAAQPDRGAAGAGAYGDAAAAGGFSEAFSNADFQRLVGRDKVTGLPNRFSFNALLVEQGRYAVASGYRLSLLLIQQDGDAAPALSEEVFCGLARRLRQLLRRPEDAMASLGAGQLAALLPYTDALGAMTVAKNLKTALAENAIPGAEAVTWSIGVATYCGKGGLPEGQLMEQAAEALTVARKAGDRISRYDPMVTTLRPQTYQERVEGAAMQQSAGG